MVGILLKNGFEAGESLEDADYIVINTCGFLEAAREESLDTIGEILDEKKESAKVIVTGCMVQSHGEIIKDHYPEVDYLLGSGDVEAVLTAVKSKEQGEIVSDAKSYLEQGDVPRVVTTSSTYAYLKIAEGCKKRCSYCIIPKIKGGLRSKPIERVVREFRSLRDQGMKEIILIAQDLGDWGKDLGYKRSDGLVALLKELLKEEGDFWLRLLYLYPDEITDELIELMKSDARICPYLDMPIQHVNNEMLKKMHRATSKEDIVRIIGKLRSEIPGIAIRTSLIVGFPGETEEQFEELCAFVKEFPLDNVGIFTYSKEAGSHSALLPGHLDEDVKEARQQKLAAIQQEIALKINEEKVGKVMDVLVEGYHPESDLLMVGRHKGQCPDIDGIVMINDPTGIDEFGKVYPVEVSQAMEYDLVGAVAYSSVGAL
ncbi:MAG: Ribosomal protein S12 methylthiotransferase RimO [Chlamydiia bacterium]|nr:Ribosomal protein S12 methylthiotransferase RimO [Chlamydiia bacterium]MCH9615907.1 Ribosomal protein S12 methylthiotransferase RimO [Chlamydiia bacterium]MCH9628690.1 Ribosomal protein S12 methylthiotransferase RimO [Chlamydiia bacterium]